MAGKIPKRAGRPSTYTEKIGAEICRRIAEGKSLRSISRMPGMPDMNTVWDWRGRDPDFDRQYARARCDQADAHVEEMLDVARGARRAKTSEAAQGCRLLVDTLKWRASKMKPKNYGDRLVVEAEVNVREMTDEQIRNRVTELLAGLEPKP